MSRLLLVHNQLMFLWSLTVELWRQVVTRMAVRIDEILWLKSVVFVRQGRLLLKVSQLGDSYSLNMTTVSRLDIHSAHSQSVNDKGIILNWPKSCQLVQHPNISIFVCHEDCCRTYTTTELTSFCFISYQNSAGKFTMNHFLDHTRARQLCPKC